MARFAEEFRGAVEEWAGLAKDIISHNVLEVYLNGKALERQTGESFRSVQIDLTGERNGVFVRTDNGILIMWEETGTRGKANRDRIYPKRAKALRFEIDGRVIFAKWVRAQGPRPWLGPALEDAEPILREMARRVPLVAFERAFPGMKITLDL